MLTAELLCSAALFICVPSLFLFIFLYVYAVISVNTLHAYPPPTTPQPFYGPFPGPPGWAGARRELLDFMVQGKINRGRHFVHPAGHHSIQTNQCPPPPSPIFYRPDALPATQPTVSKHWRQLAHLDYGEDARVFLSGVICTVSIPLHAHYTLFSYLAHVNK